MLSCLFASRVGVAGWIIHIILLSNGIPIPLTCARIREFVGEVRLVGQIAS